METSEGARTVRRGQASKLGCEMERTRLCVCHRVSFSRSVVMFGALFVCWIVWTRASLCHVDHSSHPPLSPLRPPLLHLCLLSILLPSSLISLHMFTCFVLFFTTVFFITESSPFITDIRHTHTLSRRRDAVRQHIHFSCLFPFVRPFCRHSLYCPQILWLPPLIFIMFLPSLFLYSCLLSPCTPLPFSFILRPLIHFKAADKHVGFVPVLINRRKQNLH